jgi:hypothetical protein
MYMSFLKGVQDCEGYNFPRFTGSRMPLKKAYGRNSVQYSTDSWFSDLNSKNLGALSG